jgi:hypothetical protein
MGTGGWAQQSALPDRVTESGVIWALIETLTINAAFFPPTPAAPAPAAAEPGRSDVIIVAAASGGSAVVAIGAVLLLLLFLRHRSKGAGAAWSRTGGQVQPSMREESPAPGFSSIAAAFNKKYDVEQKLKQAEEALTENVNYIQTLRNQKPLPKVQGRSTA